MKDGFDGMISLLKQDVEFDGKIFNVMCPSEIENTEYCYSESGKLLRSVNSANGCNSVYSYNDEGLLVKVETSMKSGKMGVRPNVSVTRLEYDDSGRLIHKKSAILDETWTYGRGKKYDYVSIAKTMPGKIDAIEKLSVGMNGDIKSKEMYFSDGLLMRSKIVNKSKKVNGVKVTTSHYHDSDNVDIITVFHDNNIDTKTIITNQGTKVFVYEYDAYDQISNVILTINGIKVDEYKYIYNNDKLICYRDENGIHEISHPTTGFNQVIYDYTNDYKLYQVRFLQKDNKAGCYIADIGDGKQELSYFNDNGNLILKAVKHEGGNVCIREIMFRYMDIMYHMSKNEITNDQYIYSNEMTIYRSYHTDDISAVYSVQTMSSEIFDDIVEMAFEKYPIFNEIIKIELAKQ